MASKQEAAGWTPMLFEEMAEQVSERVYDPVAAGISIYVGLEHLSADDLRIRSDKPATEVTYGTHGKLRLRPGQIAFGRRRTNLRKLGVSEIDAVCSEHSMILNERLSLVPGFLPFFMQSDVFMDRALEISEGSLSPTIKWATMAQQTFLIPPPQQQRELVELLHGIDRAIEAGTETLESTLIARNSSFKELIRPKGKRKALKVSDMASVMIGRQLSPSKKQGVRPVDYLRAINVNSGKIGLLDINSMDFSEEEEKKYRIYEGDTLIVEGGASVGHCAKFTSDMGKFCFQNTLLRLRPKDSIDADLLYYAVLALHTEGTLEKLAKGSGIKHLGVKGVENLEFELPTDPRERRSILDTIKAMENLAHDLHSNVANLRTLRAAILNTALSPAPAATSAPAPALVPA